MSEVKKVKNESIKESSNGLRGTIAEELNDESLIKFSEDNLQVLKFHGIYQQDDRDKRKALIKEKKERDYSFMIRTKICQVKYIHSAFKRFQMIFQTGNKKRP